MIPPFNDAGDLPPGLHATTWEEFCTREEQLTPALYIDFFSRDRDGKIIGMVEVTL